MVQGAGFSKKRICRHRSASFWKKTMKEFEESSLSVAAFCQEKNLAYGTFMNRRTALKKVVPRATFVPVKIEDPVHCLKNIDPPQDKKILNLEVKKDWVLKVGRNLSLCVPSDFNEAGLKRLVRVLSTC